VLGRRVYVGGVPVARGGQIELARNPERRVIAQYEVHAFGARVDTVYEEPGPADAERLDQRIDIRHTAQVLGEHDPIGDIDAIRIYRRLEISLRAATPGPGSSCGDFSALSGVAPRAWEIGAVAGKVPIS